MTGRINIRTLILNLVLTVILICILGFNYQQEKQAREDIANLQGQPPGVGSMVPDFTVINGLGEKVKFKELLDQETLLVLWYIGCQPSVQFLDAVNELLIENDQLKVMPVNITNSLEEVRDYFVQKGWHFPVYVDADKSAKWGFKATITPAVYLVSSEGKIVFRQLGTSKQGYDYIANWLVNN